MQVLQNRINSFSSKPKRKQGKSHNIKWPHPEYFTATPVTLAEAGFYYDPSPEDVDNVTCYMCGKELSEWAEDDDPFDIHFKKCGKKCAWAVVRCGLRSDMDQKNKFVFTDKNRLPTSKPMEKARLETFTYDGWQYDSVKNHSASSREMARAGFVYSPVEVGDDLATCLYCGVSLSGWEPDDDPTEEHRKRVKSSGIPCPMFPDIVISKSYKDTTVPTKIHDGEEDEDEAPARAGSSTSKTPRSSHAKSTAKTPRSRARSSSKSRKATGEEEEEEEEEEEDAVPAGKPQRKRTVSTSRPRSVSRPPSEAESTTEGRPTRSRTTSTSRPRAKSKAAASDTDDDSRASSTKQKKSRSKSKSRVSVIPEDMGAEDDEKEAPAPPKAASKTPSRQASRTLSKKASKLLDDDQPATKPTKPTSRSTRSKSVVPDPVGLYDEEEVEPEAPPPRTRKTSKPPSSSAARSKALKSEQSADEAGSSKITTTTKKVKRTRAEKERRNQAESDSDSGTKAKPAGHKRTASTASRRSKAPVPAAEVKDEVMDVSDEEISRHVPPPSPPVQAEAEPEPEPMPESIFEPEPEAAPPKPLSKSAQDVTDDTSRVVKTEKAASQSTTSSRKPADTRQDEVLVINSKAGRKQLHRTPSTSSFPFPPVPADKPKPEPLPSKYQGPPRTPIDAPIMAGFVAETASRFAQPHQQPRMKPNSKEAPTARPVSEASSSSSLLDSKDPKSTGPPIPPRHPLRGNASYLGSFKRDQSASESDKDREELQVVEILTDEDDDANRSPSPKKFSKNTRNGLANRDVRKEKVEQPVVEKKPQKIMAERRRDNDEDVEMSDERKKDTQASYVEMKKDDEEDIQMDDAVEDGNQPTNQPTTPPTRSIPFPKTPLAKNGNTLNTTIGFTPGFQFVPALSKEPFVNLTSLTDEESTMTVEEWIRYQMGIEYERFKEDGERELAAFERKVDEIRRTIEAL